MYRPDLVTAAPRGWAEVPALARERRVALCLGGPHAFLAVLAMCAPVAAQAAKANLLAARSMGLEQAIQYEREMQAICMGPAMRRRDVRPSRRSGYPRFIDR